VPKDVCQEKLPTSILLHPAQGSILEQTTDKVTMEPHYKELVRESLETFAGFSPERQQTEIAKIRDTLARYDKLRLTWQELYSQNCIRCMRIFLRVVERKHPQIALIENK
jgi:hypothetical protein